MCGFTGWYKNNTEKSKTNKKTNILGVGDW